MEKIKVVIADDEKHIRDHIKLRLLEVWPEIGTIVEAADGHEAIETITRCRPDVAFLDINMPGLTGMQVAAAVSSMCPVVFVTSYEQFAVEAFEKEAVDYLLKPVMSDRLAQAVQKIKRRIREHDNNTVNIKSAIDRITAQIENAAKKSHLNWIRVYSGNCIQIIPVDDVYAFQATNKYTTVITKDKEYLIRKPIKELTEELDDEYFWQIHRGAIVNVRFISKVSRSASGRCILNLSDTAVTLKVSRTFSHLFKQM